MDMLFGGQLIDPAAMKATYKNVQPGTTQKVIWKSDPVNRQVFNNSAPLAGGPTPLNDMFGIFKAAAEAGGPVSATMELKLIDNPIFGTKVSDTLYTVKFSVLANCWQWNQALPTDIQAKIGKKGDPLENFPNVKTFKQNALSVIQLKPEQAQMLGNLAYWMIKQDAADYQQLLGGKSL